MILADTSLWIEHFRRKRVDFSECLNRGEVMTHSLVIGELACGSFRNREAIFHLLRALPRALECSHVEVLTLIEQNRLYSLGLGIVDMHLLASARVSRIRLWTLDRRLQSAARGLAVAYAD